VQAQEPVHVPEAPKPDTPPAAADAEPFWKKEISFRRKPRAAVEVAAPPEPKPSAEPAADAKPFWKKEISFRRKPRAAAAVAAAEPKTEAEAPTVELEPQAESKPKPESKPKQKSKRSRLPKLEARPRRIKRDKSGRPLPQRHKNVVGLKIGASQLAAARVSNNGVAELQQLARTKLDAGIVVGGELREPELLARALKSFFKEHKLPRRGVRLGVANNRIGVRTLEIAGISDAKQLDNAVRFRAQEVLPIPINEAVLDYQLLDERTDADGKNVKRVLLVVAYRELVDRYVTACNKAGIQLVGIDLEAFALLRSLAAPAEADAVSDAAVVVVSVGHDRTTFAVSDGRECAFTRVLEWGGGALDVAVARVIDTTPSEAEPFKRALEVDGTRVPEGLTQDQFARVQDAVRRQIESFARDLVSSLQFYQAQPDSLAIVELVLTGGGAHLRGLAEELERLVGVPVRVGDPLARVVVHKNVRESEQIGSLAAAIGLGIHD
jgi:type IV pilus assembly protein PilM